MCPFDYDIVPQYKTHISENEVCDEKFLKSVYGKMFVHIVISDLIVGEVYVMLLRA
jgi:hypothetical protein